MMEAEFCDLPEEIQEAAASAVCELVPDKSKARYERTYLSFEQWCGQKNVKVINENVLLAFFSEKALNFKPSSLWSTYSMLKSQDVRLLQQKNKLVIKILCKYYFCIAKSFLKLKLLHKFNFCRLQ